ncbi:MAG: NAD-dependent deacylase [Candidatus Aegiribacteria sp.]|nr:NAD-dependent deacylase [Candidatus Aegiribacteria sp.]
MTGLSSEKLIDEAIEMLAGAEMPVISTGAGMSSESGVRTFRGEDGYWREHRAEDLASPEGLRKDPELVWKWYGERLKAYEDIQPHAGYHALAQLQERIVQLPVVTQNVDGLLQKAGLTDVTELHGSLRTASCMNRCGSPPIPITEELFESLPPRCSCGSILRPDVVLFGEQLPEQAMRRAFDLAESCDLMLVVGTSMLVYPASSLPLFVLRRGMPVIEINPEETPLTSLAGVISIHDAAGQILPLLVEGVLLR